MLELYHKGRRAIIKIYDHAMKYETEQYIFQIF